MLSIRNLQASYGLSQVLFGVDLDIGEGEVVALLGRNGMGKTTTVMSTMGLMPARGEVQFGGNRIERLKAFQIPRAGIGLVPEGRRIFPNLTVRENLVATAANRRGVATSVDAGDGDRTVPAAGRAPGQLRQPPLRRRTADAGHCTRTHDQSAAC